MPFCTTRSNQCFYAQRGIIIAFLHYENKLLAQFLSLKPGFHERRKHKHKQYTQTQQRIHYQYLLLGQKTLINHKVMRLRMLLALMLASLVETRLKHGCFNFGVWTLGIATKRSFPNVNICAVHFIKFVRNVLTLDWFERF